MLCQLGDVTLLCYPWDLKRVSSMTELVCYWDFRRWRTSLIEELMSDVAKVDWLDALSISISLPNGVRRFRGYFFS